jgi:phospholipid/cholesterol/gamma-HCH transport system substrate-binding protein
MSRSKEIKIGILAIVSSVLLYTGFNFLKGSDFFSQIKQYYVYLDNVNGLTISNPVMLNGLAVGRVSDIVVLQNDQHRMKVALQIRSDLALGKGTEAILGDNGLLGGKMIDLKITAEKPLIENGGTLVGKLQEGMMASITKKADPIIAQTDSLMRTVRHTLKGLDGMQDDLKVILSNIKQMTGSLNNTLQKGDIDRLLANANQASQNLTQLLKDLQPLPNKVSIIADKFTKLDLDQTMKQAQEAMTKMNGLMSDLQQGKGSIGALLKTDSLHKSIVKLTQDLDKVVIDLRENPKKYIDLNVIERKKK